MITKEAIEAACAVLNERDKGNAINIPDVVAMLTAAFAAMPAEREIDEGRFEEWTLADFAGQCRMQARENLDPEYSQFMAALAARLSSFAAMPGPAVKVECPCTTFEQDEDCPIGYPSMLCSSCDGTGLTTVETVAALAAEMLKIAEQVDELEDPFAAWETIELLKSQQPSLTPAPDLASENERLRAALEKVVDWASRRCPADDESVPCPLCGARADIPGDFCKSVESIFPRDLLRDTRAALERT